MLIICSGSCSLLIEVDKIPEKPASFVRGFFAF